MGGVAEDLKVGEGKGVFLPPPWHLWGGENPQNQLVRRETLGMLWKLLVVRPIMFYKGQLVASEAYLSTSVWRDLLMRKGSDVDPVRVTDGGKDIIWSSGKLELWGRELMPQALQRARQLVVYESTIKHLDCYLHHTFKDKFSQERDPQNRLSHYLIFRLSELTVLHDFASYHPDLQREADGRWCPPPFDSYDTLFDFQDSVPLRQTTVGFTNWDDGTTEKEKQAMREIEKVVRWQGRNGARGWELEDGEEHRKWLQAFRSLLGKMTDPWVGNTWFDKFQESRKGVDLLTCRIGVDVTSATMAELLMGTHVRLCLRAGRVPWIWLNRPVYDRFRCIPCSESSSGVMGNLEPPAHWPRVD